MHTPGILERHPALRWLLPAGVACVAGLVATGMLRASASSESLPQTTPAALIAAVQGTDVEGFSGTVVSHLSLGLPELPTLPSVGQQSSFDALLSGSHTMQVWYGGVDKQRIALLGATDETDLFRNGSTVWQWSSADGVALHADLPPRVVGGAGLAVPTISASLTPAELARRALEAMDPTTHVTVETDQTVADRSAYELILTPRSSATKIGSVHIAVDGSTKVPLGVQVYPRGSSSAAIDVAFTSIHFGAQPDRNFEFSPPPNAQVRNLTRSAGTDAATSAPARHSATTTGSGWTTVVGLDPGRKRVAEYTTSPLFKQLTPVAGSWGKGRLLDSALVSVLVTDDGRVFAGAVGPADLYTAAATK